MRLGASIPAPTFVEHYLSLSKGGNRSPLAPHIWVTIYSAFQPNLTFDNDRSIPLMHGGPIAKAAEVGSYSPWIRTVMQHIERHESLIAKLDTGTAM